MLTFEKRLGSDRSRPGERIPVVCKERRKSVQHFFLVGQLIEGVVDVRAIRETEFTFPNSVLENFSRQIDVRNLRDRVVTRQLDMLEVRTLCKQDLQRRAVALHWSITEKSQDVDVICRRAVKRLALITLAEIKRTEECG